MNSPEFKEFKKSMEGRLDKIDKNVSDLLKFKWQATGMAIFCGFLVGIIEVIVLAIRG